MSRLVSKVIFEGTETRADSEEGMGSANQKKALTVCLAGSLMERPRLSGRRGGFPVKMYQWLDSRALIRKSPLTPLCKRGGLVSRCFPLCTDLFSALVSSQLLKRLDHREHGDHRGGERAYLAFSVPSVFSVVISLLAIAIGTLTLAPQTAQADAATSLGKLIHQSNLKEVPTHLLVKWSVMRYVGDNPEVSVKTIGSWIKATKYNDPLTNPKFPSDHDMTLVMPSTMDQGQMVGRWKQAQRYIQDDISEILRKAGRGDDEIARVVNSISVYPPEQLLQGVSNNAEAVERYQQVLKGKPALGDEPIEGLWGDEAAKGFRQAYEVSSGGRVIYNVGGKIHSGFADLNHMLEGYGKFTLDSTADLSNQFLVKTNKAFKAGQAKDIAKNMERLDLYLKKTKSLARVKASVRPNATMSRLWRDIKGQVAKVDDPLQKQQLYEAWLKNNQKLISETLEHAQTELALCRQLARTMDPGEVRMIYQLLESPRWVKFKNKLVELWRKGKGGVAKMPWRGIVKGMRAAMWAVEIHGLVGVWQEKGMNAALNHGAARALMMQLNLPTAAMQIIFEMALEQSKYAGYGFAASYQECDQLMAGIYMVKGHERLAEGRDIPTLAREEIFDHVVLDELRRHARAAARRQREASSEQEIEQGLEQALIQRCTTPVLRAWERERMGMIAELYRAKNLLDRLFTNTLLGLEYEILPGQGGDSRLLLYAVPSQGRRAILDAMMQLRDRLQDLGGKDRRGEYLLEERYHWSLDGKPPQTFEASLSRDGSASYVFDPRARHAIDLKGPAERKIGLSYSLTLAPKLVPAPDLRDELQYLTQTYTLSATAEVDPAIREVRIEGPREILLGKDGALQARVAGGLDDDYRYWWRDEAGTLLGDDPRLSLQPQAAGRYPLFLSVYRQARGELKPVGEAAHRLSVLDPLTLSFRVVDAETGERLDQPQVRLSGHFKGSGDYIGMGANGLVMLPEIAPGAYSVEASAPGYHTMIHNDVYSVGGVHTLRLPKLEEETPPPDGSPPDETDGGWSRDEYTPFPGYAPDQDPGVRECSGMTSEECAGKSSGGQRPADITSADARWLYQRYTAAYTRYTHLVSQGKGETPEAQAALEEYRQAKAAYEAIQ